MMKRIELSNKFIEKITKKHEPNWGVLGWVTFSRTYARTKEDGTKETFAETLKRVVEGNINLDPRLKKGRVPKKVVEELTKEAEELFVAFYTMQSLPAGRSLWISGTEFADLHGDALNNCWFVSARPQPYGESKIVPFYTNTKREMVSFPFAYLFDQSMKGGGVGFSVAEGTIENIPNISMETDLRIICSDANPEKDRFELDEKHEGEKVTTFVIPDSREGWVEALALVIDSHFDRYFGDFYEGINKINIDISEIRPEGSLIKGFGGIASGAEPLVQLLRFVNDLLNNNFDQELTSVDVTDIMNYIGKTVVAGNVRRSAEIAIGEATDEAFIKMKQDKEKLMSHRWASNNTVLVSPTFNDYNSIAEAIAINGEPAVANLFLARNFGRMVDGFNPEADPKVEGWNPCGEITIENGEPCNLVELFPLNVHRMGGDPAKILALITRYAKRVTFSNYDWEVTRNVVERNRRLGVSISGQQDWFLEAFDKPPIISWDYGSLNDGSTYRKPIYNPEIIATLDEYYEHVKQADVEYSKELKCNKSIKLTTVKPSGTISLLTGMSAGIHANYSDYYIRRIRFQKDDKLVQILRDGGYYIEDDLYSPNTVVVEFPVKVPSADNPYFKGAGDITIEEQFALQALLQRYWADNSVSCTITFKEEEKKDIATMLKAYKGQLKSTSLLPYSGHGYEQAPYEPITPEEFESRMKDIKGRPEDLAKGNDTAGAEIEIDECAEGVCPIK